MVYERQFGEVGVLHIYTIVVQLLQALPNAFWVILVSTLCKFVHFVSTPEVLERVTTLESKILQLKDAIAIQSNDSH